jgi:radical SAM superfamily enzyme YgiQ (UPF0313 family)
LIRQRLAVYVQCNPTQKGDFVTTAFLSSALKTLFLQAPSFHGFDGDAGSRYQAKREVKSFWFPTWLAQPAALVPESRLLDAPVEGLTVEQCLVIAAAYDLVILHTSTPSFPEDAKFAELLKQHNPRIKIGMVGAKTMVDPEGSLRNGIALDFVCREEFDYTCKEVAEGMPLSIVKGLSFRDGDGRIQHNAPRAAIENMDELPFVAPVYKRDLRVDRYFIGYLKHPYVSIYTGRGCRSKCTFCLWPQTVGGHRYRVRSADNVIAEVKWIKEHMPEVREIMFDVDTFTDSSNLSRVEAIARGMGALGVTWSCNAKANVPYATLKVMKENGLRLLLAGYESGDDQILHKKTINFAKEINPHTIQVSLAAPYPGTALYSQALKNGWLQESDAVNLVNDDGVQVAAIGYPHLSKADIFHSMEVFYRRFYLRPAKIWEIVREMLGSGEMITRRLREGVEFWRFLRTHEA